MCLKAWITLDSARGIGMVAGPIPWPAIEKWCTRERLNRSATDIVESVLRRLDSDRAAKETDRMKRERDAAEMRARAQASNRPTPGRR